MSQSIEVQMLDALEIFHYSCRFQNHLFVLNLEDELDIGNIITDLRVLNRAQIQVIVVLADYAKLPERLELWNHQGCPLVYSQMTADTELAKTKIDSLSKDLTNGNIPVLGLNQNRSSNQISKQADQFTLELADCLSVDKVFFLSNSPGLFINDQFISHTTPQEIEIQLEQAEKINIGRSKLSFYVEQNKKNGFDIVLLEGNTGCLFQEIFSHRGKGTLLASDYPNIIRQGKTSDVMDISLLMKPYVNSGTMLPVTEENLSRDIADYYVYTVNNSIVAAARLKDYGTASELAKFATLPRYQGKGRAKELAELMIKKAHEAQKHSIFALTVEPMMFEFFIGLGFHECNRDTLPESWKSKYDMARPSTAFIKHLNVDSA